MAFNFNLEQLVGDIKGAASGALGRDVSELRGFSDRQVKAIADQTELVSRGIATGQITEATRDFFLDGLKKMAQNFASTLRGLMAVTVEKVRNAVVSVLWKTISTATGIALPG